MYLCPSWTRVYDVPRKYVDGCTSANQPWLSKCLRYERPKMKAVQHASESWTQKGSYAAGIVRVVVFRRTLLYLLQRSDRTRDVHLVPRPLSTGLATCCLWRTNQGISANLSLSAGLQATLFFPSIQSITGGHIGLSTFRPSYERSTEGAMHRTNKSIPCTLEHEGGNEGTRSNTKNEPLPSISRPFSPWEHEASRGKVSGKSAYLSRHVPRKHVRLCP